jgi:hypothetical protein
VGIQSNLTRLLLVVVLLAAALTPGRAQFTEQATWGGTGAGTANAQTVTIANVSTINDVLGVPIRWVPNIANTGSTTLAVTGTAATLIKKPGGSGLVNLSGGELQIGQPVTTLYDGTEYVLLNGNAVIPPAAVNSTSLANSALTFGSPINMQLNATVSANALTIALKGNNGADPSATNPVLIPFRDVTLTSGDPVIISQQAALSFTVASTNTMGCLSATNCRLWISAMNNGGTLVLCASNQLSFDGVAGHAASVQPLYEDTLKTSAAGTTGGSTAQTIYCSTSAVTAKAIKILGYIEIQETVAGTWATGPTIVQLLAPGTRRPGEVVQILQPAVGTSTSQAIVPLSSANPVRFTASTQINVSVPAFATVNFIRAATTLLSQTVGDNSTGTGTASYVVSATILDVPATASSVTYSISTATGASIFLEEIMG